MKKCCKIYDFRCAYCDYSTPIFSSEILSHLQLKHNGLDLYCKASYENATNSLRSKSTKRNDNNIDRFSCDFCPRKFITKARLISHLNHECRQIFVCPWCKKYFSDKRVVSKHVVIHNC